jgi:tetratricopeptide (TPR) repeat protein/serine/threonine protein kinase
MSEREIFVAALHRSNPAERLAFLDGACGDDRELRERVEELLREQEQLGSFLERPAEGLGKTGAFAPPPDESSAAHREGPGTLIGPYKLLQQIGEGGMGTVWMGEQAQPVQRRVALKIIKAGMDSKQVLARFEAERQALALMDHPNIARVLDAGTTSGVRSQESGVRDQKSVASSLTPDSCPLTPVAGRPYFVMELVKGQPITQYCDQQRLTPRERLELFVPVCQAIQHAHQKGIIHRDIKPSNVLVAPYDGKPVVKVIDFGVAKATGQRLTEKTLFTEFGAVVGTLEYMSPEQAELNNQDIDTRSDIYSLGVLLYELLTGTTPLDRARLKKAAFTEMLRMIREEEPPRPSTRLSEAKDTLPSISAQRKTEPAKLTRLVRGELDWIVMKALEKDRNRRYETANSFAIDVQRYLADEPVQACPPSLRYRFRKFARRHKRGLAMLGVLLVALLLVISTIAGSVGWVLRDRAAQQGYAEREAAGALDEAGSLCQRSQWPQAQAKLGRAETVLGDWGNASLRSALERVRLDLWMGTELEEIRLQMSGVQAATGPHFDTKITAADFAAAFGKYGLPVLEMGTEEASERIRTSAIRPALLVALDQWAGFQSVGPAARTRLFAVAQGADDDDWRRRCREVLRRRGPTARRREDEAALLRLAGQREALDQAPATLVLLASSIGWYDPAAAVALLRPAQQCDPTDLWLNLELGSWLVQLETPRYEEAISFNRAAVALRPHSAGAWINLGASLGKADRLDEAIAAFERAIHLRPDMALAHHNLGAALERKDEPDRAIPALREAIRLRPNFADSHNGLGKVLRATGKLDEAITAHREAIRLRPNFADAHSSLGTALSEKGRLDRALVEYRVAIRLQPDTALFHSNLAGGLLEKGEVDAALKEIEIALCIDSQLADAHVNLGNALSEKRRLDEAVAAYEEAIRLKPRNAPAYTSLGNALHARGQLKEALAAHEKAIEYQPNAALPHSNRGNILYVLDRLDEAIAAYQKALRLKPDLPHAHHGLGGALVGKGRVKEALASYEQAIRHEPDAPHSYFSTAEVLQEQGRLVEALDFQRRGHALLADKKWAGDPTPLLRSHNTLGTLLAKLGKRNEAEKELCAALALGKKLVGAKFTIPEHRQHLATSHTVLGWFLISDPKRQGEVEPEFRAALALRKELAEQCLDRPAYREELAKAHLNLGHVLAGKRKWSEVETEFRAALAVHKKLAEDFVTVVRHQVGVGGVLSLLGHVAKERDRPKEALAWYDQAIRVLTPIVARQPQPGKAREFLRNSHSGRGEMLDKQERFGEAASAWALALELGLPQDKAFYQRRLMVSRAEAGQLELALKDADQLALSKVPDVVYNCACVYALAHARSRDGKQADRTIKLLRQAIAEGLQDVVGALKDQPALDSVRGRDEFKKLLAEAEKKK